MKRMVSGIMLALLLMGMLTLALNIRTVSPVESINYGIVSANDYMNVNVSEAKQMIESSPGLVILDVRTSGEYESGHLENAVLIPVTELEDRIDELDEEKQTLVYCKSGGRSSTASQILVDNGFSSVYNMLGGITAWRNAGYWIEIIHRGDLVVDGTQTFVIENCTYILAGNIYVRDWSKLIISNAVFELGEEYPGQFAWSVENYANLEIKNVVTNSEFSISNHGHASTRINNSKMSPCWIPCDGDSVVEVSNSTVGEIIMGGSSRVTVENATLSVLLDTPLERAVRLWDIQPGLYVSWNLHEDQPLFNVNYDLTLMDTHVDWCVAVDSQSMTTISNSTLGMIMGFSHTTTQIKDFRPGFHKRWSYGEITLENCTVGFTELHLHGTSCTIANSTIFCFSWGETNVSLIQSSIGLARYNDAFGILYSNGTTFTCFGFLNSNLFVYGDLEFPQNRNVEFWISSNVTRNFNVISRDANDNPTEYAELNLFDQNDTIVWNGVTDSLGRANFNLTFTEVNYTDTLRLEAVKGNLSATEYIGFLSDTPIILTLGNHDITITDVTSFKNIVGQGYSLFVNVTVENQGTFAETFNVGIYANTTIIQTKTITLADGTSAIVTFEWNTTGFAQGNYTVRAYAWPVLGEANTADNTYVDDWIVVTISGDVDGDFDVDLYDAVNLLVVYGVKKDNPKYDPNCDIDGDGEIDLYDAVRLLTHYGQKYP